MLVAVTSQGPAMDSEVDPRFGRARYFIVVDTETGGFEAHDNTENVGAAQGAGIQAARAIVDLQVQAVITGHVGPKAFEALRAGDVRTYVGAAGLVSEALDKLASGQLSSASSPDVAGHWR
jgi:predicted Fe-Mo cluster-binding NifX family protein